MTAPQQDLDTSIPPATSGKKRSRWTSLRIVIMRLLLLVLFLIGFFCSVIPWGRAFARSALVLPSLITFSPVPPLHFFGETVHRTQMDIPSQTGTALLDIFTPNAPSPQLPGVRGGMIIVSGVGNNRDVPQLVNLMESLARTNLVAMHVTAPVLRYSDLSAQDSDAVVRAFGVLERWPGMEGKRIGMMAISAGVPAVCFAAADPRIRDRVASVTTFGGHFDTLTLVRAIARQAVEINGQTERWVPNEIPIQVLAYVVARHVPREDGDRLITTAFNNVPLTDKEIAQLSPPARAAYRILSGTAPDQVEENLAALPPTLLTELETLSPSRVIDQIRAPIFLLHDRYDTSLPYTESRAFAAALDQQGHPHRYVEFQIFDHVTVREQLGFWPLLNEGSQLFTLLLDVLSANT